MKLIVASSKTTQEEFMPMGRADDHLRKLTAIAEGHDLDEYVLPYFDDGEMYAFVITEIRVAGPRSFSVRITRGEREFNPPLSARIEL